MHKHHHVSTPSLLQTQQARTRRQVNRLSWPRRGSQPSVPAEPRPRGVSVIRPSGPDGRRHMAWPWPLKRGLALDATPCGPHCRCPGDRRSKTPEGAAACQEHGSPVLQDPRTAGQAWSQGPAACAVRICGQAERRLGLFPMQRRQLTLSGVRAWGLVPSRGENV